ncbi:unnamed protein product [Didymodactylos carnosus]|uniref:Gag-like protein n=1 Tax=Didymodactylos carnosus TaxID=1234261 RepID=A0A814PJ88_9BILA|nr:unnamed protein product [Didymodactylos carnosus]CAF3870169.1 unnamed protein product [Didymodactylos carnosus]
MKRRVAFTPEPFPPFILSFTGNTASPNEIRTKLIDLKNIHKCPTTCRFNSKKDLLLFPQDDAAQQYLSINLPLNLFGDSFTYTSRTAKVIQKTFSCVLKNVDSSINEIDLLTDIRDIVSDVVAVSRIKNAAQNTPTSLLRIDFSNETARNDLLQKRKLIVTPFTYPVIEYIPPVKIIRCFKCHYANECNNQIKCGKCSGNHGLDNCTNTTLNCPNCGDAHKVTYPGCKVRLQYINNIKAKSYAEALSAASPHLSSQNSQQHPLQSNQQTTTVALRPSISTTNETNLLSTLKDISKSSESVTVEINQIKSSFYDYENIRICLFASKIYCIDPVFYLCNDTNHALAISYDHFTSVLFDNVSL